MIIVWTILQEVCCGFFFWSKNCTWDIFLLPIISNYNRDRFFCVLFSSLFIHEINTQWKSHRNICCVVKFIASFFLQMSMYQAHKCYIRKKKNIYVCITLAQCIALGIIAFFQIRHKKKCSIHWLYKYKAWAKLQVLHLAIDLCTFWICWFLLYVSPLWLVVLNPYKFIAMIRLDFLFFFFWFWDRSGKQYSSAYYSNTFFFIMLIDPMSFFFARNIKRKFYCILVKHKI